VALDDGDGAIGDVRFDADLVERVRRHALLAVMTDRGDVQVWKHGRGG